MGCQSVQHILPSGVRIAAGINLSSPRRLTVNSSACIDHIIDKVSIGQCYAETAVWTVAWSPLFTVCFRSHYSQNTNELIKTTTHFTVPIRSHTGLIKKQTQMFFFHLKSSLNLRRFTKSQYYINTLCTVIVCN